MHSNKIKKGLENIGKVTGLGLWLGFWVRVWVRVSLDSGSKTQT
jgi:hypothetical protein